jgi:serine/threonine protein kinase
MLAKVCFHQSVGLALVHSTVQFFQETSCPSSYLAKSMQVRLLRRAADVAAGVSYLHSRHVCHGDLKCENVLLRSEPQDPDGAMAKVADFGLSRALAFGQVGYVVFVRSSGLCLAADAAW